MRYTVLISAGLLLVPMTRSLGQLGNREIIAYAKRINVCRLDPRLPRQRFDRWFKEIVGPSAKIEWEVNDCGEQTGSPADKGRDFPFCAQAEATLPDGRKAGVMSSV